VAARSKAWVCGRSLAGIAGLNPAGCMAICLLRVLCVARYSSLRRADHSFRGVLQSVVICHGEASIMIMPWPTRDRCALKKHYFNKLQIGLAFAHIVYVHICLTFYICLYICTYNLSCFNRHMSV